MVQFWSDLGLIGPVRNADSSSGFKFSVSELPQILFLDLSKIKKLSIENLTKYRHNAEI